MNKRLISLALALALCLGLTVPAFAASASGSCGANVRWSYGNGTLTIQGTGPMDDYTLKIQPWYDYREEIHTVIIGSGVTSIGSHAFFNDYTSLTSVTIPSSVTSIGGYAFFETPWLQSLGELPVVNGILIAYQGSGGNVTIPSSVTSISEYAFSSCTNLTSVTIPNSVTSIGDNVFFYCVNLISVTIPGSVTSIGSEAFFGCNKLTSVTIPASVTSIGRGAFRSCSNLTSIRVASGNPAYSFVDGILFNTEQTLLHTYPAGKNGVSYSIPASVTRIEDSAFSGCTSLTSVTIPGSVTSIGSDAFYGCNKLTSVTIPSSVTSIGIGTFGSCSSLTTVTIPGSVTAIEKRTFSGCNSLTDIYYGGSESQWKKVPIGGDNRPLTNATIHYNSAMPTTPVEPEPPATPAFTDVPAGEWYADAVAWTVENKITNGTTKGKFSPGKDCTQAQILTFLYRAERGQGAASAEDMEKAIRWAKEKGMIDDSFDGSKPCTRSTAVSYIWQAFDKPSAKASSFTDVDANADYAEAVSWAVEKGVTNGTNTDGTTFSPDKVCTRGHIVTLLYRAYNN